MTGLSDAPARQRSRRDTGSTIFVEAGAGSGKTESLIERVRNLVMVDGVPLDRIVAVTFTEKAGAELRDRLRANFDRHGHQASTAAKQVLAQLALDAIDTAAIGTLHSFAQRILALYPIEAGLPPLIEVLDEVASSVAFDERWSVMQRDLLDDAALADSVLLALSAGVTFEHLRSLARAFGSDWDLIEDRVLPFPPAAVTLPDLGPLLATANEVAARVGECRNAGDKFLPRLVALENWCATMRSAQTNGERHLALVRAAELKWGLGQKANWPDLAGVKSACAELQAEAARHATAFADAALRPLAYWIAGQVRKAALARAAEGRLEFHDLLVLARQLLRSDSDVRAGLHERFRHLLLDEFQDTDPIQIELAVRIAGGRDAGHQDWRQVALPLGSLFVVGDPKQSIYRFRRADIALFLGVQDWMGATERLTTNFRAVAPVLNWTNQVFGELIQFQAGAQPAYEPLIAHRTEVGQGAPVLMLGAEPHQDRPDASTLREREAADVAAVIEQAGAQRWTVWDHRREEWRPIRWGDMAILLPARTSLPFLEQALDAVGVAYRAESSSLVYQAQEVRDLMAAARAIADPTDLLSTVTALRSPLFGCGDDDLWAWKHAGGSFNLLARSERPGPLGPVGEGLDYLRRLHWRARWMTPSEVLSAVVADRRVLEVAAGQRRARDHWRRLRFVIDQARAWSDAEHGGPGLRGYLAWAGRQAQDGSRVAEAVLPETDLDAVRIMTVHAAKGLEFPMVVLSGMSSAPRNTGGVKLLWPAAGGYSARLNKAVQTNDFEANQPLDEQMDEFERRRLLYVAATRARDHLVVSLHRTGRTSTNATLLAEAHAASAAGAETFERQDPIAGGSTSARAVSEPPPWPRWHSALLAARAAAGKPSSRSASGLEGTEPQVMFGATRPDPEPAAAGGLPGKDAGQPALFAVPSAEPEAEPPGTAKGSRDVDLPPWAKGRDGTAIGRAVHAVLQGVDLVTGAGLDPLAASQCAAEGVVEHLEVVLGYVRSALASEVVARAAQREHWRESYTGTVDDDGTVLEGVIDLLYREDDGTVVVVDYKTDAIPVQAYGARAAFYRPQIEAYVKCVRSAGVSPVRGVLLFLDPVRPAHLVTVAELTPV